MSNRRIKEKPSIQYNSVKPNYNVFIETSGSMSGYINAEPSDFVETVTNIITTIKSFKSDGLLDSLNLNYLGTTSVQSRVMADFNNRLRPSQFKPLLMGVSDFDRFFDTVLKSVNRNSVALLVSDMIFSPKKGSESDIYKFLINQKNAIQDKFDGKLDSLDISTLLLKYKSRFAGTYYNQNNKGKVINSDRPYYITIIGKAEFIKSLVAKIEFNSYKGFEAQHLFAAPSQNSIAKCIKQRNLIVGDYEFKKPATSLEIYNIETRERSFQFAIAVNLGSIHSSDDYLLNKSNYSFSPESSNYRVEKVIKVTDASNESTKGYTHILVIRTDKVNPGIQKLNLSFKNNMPGWVDASNSDTDVDIADPSINSKTFGIKKLVEGIFEAYSNKYKGRDLFNVTITVNK